MFRCGLADGYQVNAFEAGYKNQQALKSQTKPHGVKKYFRNMSSSLFSFF